MSAKQLAHQEIRNTLDKAHTLFGYNMTPSVSFDNMGRCAGQAIRKGLRHYIRLNEQLLNNSEFHEELIDTIRHEIAHLVTYFNPSLGKGHNAGWKRVAAALGAKPERCHQLPLKKARRTRKAIYVVRDKEIPVGITVHKRIQSGRSYRLRGGGQIQPDHFTGKVVMK
jgi:predicted SprT family Zn-dependent metalloprotease